METITLIALIGLLMLVSYDIGAKKGSKIDNRIKSPVELIKEAKKNKEQREMTFNGMNANEWAKNSKSVWEDLPFPRSESKVTDQDIIQEEVYSKIVYFLLCQVQVQMDLFQHFRLV